MLLNTDDIGAPPAFFLSLWHIYKMELQNKWTSENWRMKICQLDWHFFFNYHIIRLENHKSQYICNTIFVHTDQLVETYEILLFKILGISKRKNFNRQLMKCSSTLETVYNKLSMIWKNIQKNPDNRFCMIMLAYGYRIA